MPNKTLKSTQQIDIGVVNVDLRWHSIAHIKSITNPGTKHPSVAESIVCKVTTSHWSAGSGYVRKVAPDTWLHSYVRQFWMDYRDATGWPV